MNNKTGKDLVNKAIDRTDTQDRIRAVTDKYAEALSSDDKDTSKNAQRVVNEYIKQAAKKNIDKRTGQVINPFEAGGRGGTGRGFDMTTGQVQAAPSPQPERTVDIGPDDRGGDFGSNVSAGADSDPGGNFDGASSRQEFDRDPTGFSGSFKQGGLLSKPKTKKMKRGGLASKK